MTNSSAIKSCGGGGGQRQGYGVGYNTTASAAIDAIMASKASIRRVYRKDWMLCGRRRKAVRKDLLLLLCMQRRRNSIMWQNILPSIRTNRSEHKTNTNLLKHVFTFAFTLINVNFLHPWIYHWMATSSITSARITTALTRDSTVRRRRRFHNT